MSILAGITVGAIPVAKRSANLYAAAHDGQARLGRAAAIMTSGLEVLVQEVMAAITTAPWSISASWPPPRSAAWSSPAVRHRRTLPG
jgi:hypothetical protein